MTTIEDSIMEGPRSNSSSAKREIAIGLISIFLIAPLLLYYDANEWWLDWAQKYERWEIDETPVLLLLICLVMTWFSIRRWQEHAREVEKRTAINKQLTIEIAKRKQAENALRVTHGMLERQVRERTADLEHEITGHQRVNKELLSTKAYVETQSRELEEMAEYLVRARNHAEAADRSKSEFLAAMSHELRTPLNAVIGFSEIIKDETLGPVGSVKYRDYAGDIYDSGQHLLGLINDILDLSKIDSGVDELHEEEIEIPEIVRSVLTLVGQRAEQCDIKIQVELPDQLPALRADERKLKQILVNLLSNAIKFTDAGGEVALWAWHRKDRGYMFQIADTGIGIAPEDIPKALSRFRQVDGDLNRRYQGTGLGLPLTKALVEQHGGTLDMQSEVGVGTTVMVRFPAVRIVASLDHSDSLDVEDKAAS